MRSSATRAWRATTAAFPTRRIPGSGTRSASASVCAVVQNLEVPSVSSGRPRLRPRIGAVPVRLLRRRPEVRPVAPLRRPLRGELHLPLRRREPELRIRRKVDDGHAVRGKSGLGPLRHAEPLGRSVACHVRGGLRGLRRDQGCDVLHRRRVLPDRMRQWEPPLFSRRS